MRRNTTTINARNRSTNVSHCWTLIQLYHAQCSVHCKHIRHGDIRRFPSPQHTATPCQKPLPILATLPQKIMLYHVLAGETPIYTHFREKRKWAAHTIAIGHPVGFQHLILVYKHMIRSKYLSIHLSIYLSSIYLSMCIYISLSLSPSPSQGSIL